MIEVVFVRHGVTAWNRERRFQGGIDIPLLPEGLEQAARLAARLHADGLAAGVEAVVASDLGRARQTAEVIARALGHTVSADPAWRERRYGAFEGLTHEALQREHPEAYLRWARREPAFELPGGGESLLAFAQRVDAALQRLREATAAAPQASCVSGPAQRRVVVVTHGGVLDVVFRRACGLPLDARREHSIANVALNRIRYRPDGRVEVLAWGDAAHLDGLGAPAVEPPRGPEDLAGPR